MGRRLDLLTGKWIEDKPKKKAPEAAVGRAVDSYLRALGAYMRQINSGGTMRNGRWTTSGQGAGISDRIGVLPGGRMICVELKAPGKKRTITEAQYLFLANVIKRGGCGVVADCVEDVATALNHTQEDLLRELNQNGRFSSLADTLDAGKK